MEVSCSNSTDFDNKRSLELLAFIQPGCWLQFLIGCIGVINNCILLLILYKLRRHCSIEFAFILNQALVDLLTGFVMAATCARSLTCSQFRIPDIWTQSECVALFVPICILITCGQRSAFIVAIDRLINVLFPYFWVKLGRTYRFCLISIAWAWATMQETGWLYFSNSDTCVNVCFSYPSYPNSWWVNVVTVGDTSVSILIVLIYIALPLFVRTMFRKVSVTRHLTVALNNMEEKQRQMVKKVRMMSLLMVTSFVCTTFVGFIILDITGVYLTDLDTVLLIEPLAGTLSLLNTVFPLYLFAWKDKQFREKMRGLFACFDWYGKTANVGVMP